MYHICSALHSHIYSTIWYLDQKIGCFFYRSIICLLCAAVVDASFFLLSEKKSKTQHGVFKCAKMMVMFLGMNH